MLSWWWFPWKQLVSSTVVYWLCTNGWRQLMTQHSTSHLRTLWGHKSVILPSENNNQDMQLLETWLNACLDSEKSQFLTTHRNKDAHLLLQRFHSVFWSNSLQNLSHIDSYTINWSIYQHSLGWLLHSWPRLKVDNLMVLVAMLTRNVPFAV